MDGQQAQQQQTQPTQSIQKQQAPQPQPQAKKRLKDSCNSCSLAKVKCNKAKPSCKRCEARGLYCHYFPSQRSGRRSASSPAVGTTSGPASGLSTITPRPEAISFDRRNESPTTATSATVVSDSHQFADFQAANFDGEDFSFWDETISTTNLDEATFDSTMASSPHHTFFSTLDLSSNSPDFSPNFDSVDSLMNNFSLPPTPPTPSSLLESQHNPFFEDHRSTQDVPHSCLNLALNIIPILHTPPPTCTLVAVQPQDSTPCLPGADYVISTNKAIIDSLSIMLACSCSLDEQLASIISLVTFKIVASYAMAGRRVNTSSPLGGRIQAQLILSELHRVVKLVDLLSKRFEDARSRVDLPMGDTGPEGVTAACNWISASVFLQLEVDLRKRLRDVTKDLMALLRGG
ncbi:MAG: hypothetical protein M1818_001642 [Claussenomyces sp. TS43310]|nr:MAG: hypothetical protein M1818_001642 [Claussenomyces sp. TS43310]